MQLLDLQFWKINLDEMPRRIDETECGFGQFTGKNMTRLTGQKLVELRQKTVSFIFQEGNLLPDLNARDNVAQPFAIKEFRQEKPWP